MPPVLEKYLQDFPTILFLCPDGTNSMSFILSFKNVSDTEKKSIVDLLNHCGAETSFDVEDATDHSAIIVDHNEVVNFKAPAFKITYLGECLTQAKIQNIADYRQDATKHIAKDVQCMDVVYFRRQTWNSVLTEAENKWFEENINSSTFNEFKPQKCSIPDSPVDVNESLMKSSTTLGEPEEIVQNRLSSDEDSDKEAIDDQVKRNEIKENEQYTDKDKHQDKDEPLDTEKSGNSKQIKENKNLRSKAVGDKSKNETASHFINKKNDSSRSREIDGTSSTSGLKPSKWSFVDEFQSESSSEEVLQPKAAEKEKEKSFVDEFQSESSDEEVLQPKAAEKEKEKNFFDFEAGNEDFLKPNKDKKHSRLPYSYDEQYKILNYIIEHCEYSRIKGRELWMTMERRKICPNRTWQSMKEHFMKKIVLTLEAFDFLTETHKMQIKSVVF